MSTQTSEVVSKIQGARSEDKLSSLARSANEAHPGDIEAARVELERSIRRSPRLREAAIGIAARYLVRQDQHQIRSAPVKDDISDVPRKAANGRQRERMEAVSQRWYDWPLPFSMGCAGDATAEVCRTIIASYRSHESGMRHNRGIYEKLAEKPVPEGKRARDVLSAQELGALLKAF